MVPRGASPAKVAEKNTGKAECNGIAHLCGSLGVIALGEDAQR